VEDPSVAEVTSGGITWVKISYFLGHCQTCVNYAWSNTGWVDKAYLTAATGNYTCEEQAGCPKIASGFNGQSGGSPNLSAPPETSSTCSKLTTYICTWHPYATGEGNDSSAATDNPNWWYGECGFEIGCTWFWNYDWWAH